MNKIEKISNTLKSIRNLKFHSMITPFMMVDLIWPWPKVEQSRASPGWTSCWVGLGRRSNRTSLGRCSIWVGLCR